MLAACLALGFARLAALQVNHFDHACNEGSTSEGQPGLTPEAGPACTQRQSNRHQAYKQCTRGCNGAQPRTRLLGVELLLRGPAQQLRRISSIVIRVVCRLLGLLRLLLLRSLLLHLLPLLLRRRRSALWLGQCRRCCGCFSHLSSGGTARLLPLGPSLVLAAAPLALRLVRLAVLLPLSLWLPLLLLLLLICLFPFLVWLPARLLRRRSSRLRLASTLVLWLLPCRLHHVLLLLPLLRRRCLLRVPRLLALRSLLPGGRSSLLRLGSLLVMPLLLLPLRRLRILLLPLPPLVLRLLRLLRVARFGLARRIPTITALCRRACRRCFCACRCARQLLARPLGDAGIV